MSAVRPEAPAASHVYFWVLNAIANGRLVPDERYSIYWLAEELEFSRTPVREAILRLSQLGVIEIERNRGFTVRRLSVEEVRANFEGRMLLEVPAARAAAAMGSSALIDTLRQHLNRMDEFVVEANTASFLEWDRALHAEIVRAGGNARVEYLAGALRDSSVQTWNLFTTTGGTGLSGSQRHHYAIVDAIATGDAELAGRTMQAHLEQTALNLMRYVATTRGEPLPEEFAGRMVSFQQQPTN